jgi:hypothetical protein
MEQELKQDGYGLSVDVNGNIIETALGGLHLLYNKL